MKTRIRTLIATTATIITLGTAALAVAGGNCCKAEAQCCADKQACCSQLQATGSCCTEPEANPCCKATEGSSCCN